MVKYFSMELVNEEHKIKPSISFWVLCRSELVDLLIRRTISIYFPLNYLTDTKRSPVSWKLILLTDAWISVEIDIVEFESHSAFQVKEIWLIYLLV